MALKEFKESNTRGYTLAECYKDMGDMFRDKGDNAEALKHYQLARDEYQGAGNKPKAEECERKMQEQ